MLCVKCKKEIADGSVFCNWCGKKQIAEPKKHRRRANSTGTIYRRKDNSKNPWIVQKNHIYISSHPSYAEAQKALERLTDDEITDKYNMTFAKVYDLWSREHFRTISKSHQDDYSSSYNRCPTLHDRKFRSLRKSDFMDIIIRMEKDGYAESTVGKQIQLFGSMSKWAMAEDIIKVNHAQFVSTVARQKKETLPYTRQELLAIQKCTLPQAMILRILIATGCRPKDLFTARLADCHSNYFVSGSKTEAGYDRAIGVAEYGIADYTMLVMMATAAGSELLIGGYDGNRNYSNWAKREYKVLKDELHLGDKTPYSSRHTFATMAAASGMPPDLLRRQMGHKNIHTTDRIYKHVDDLAIAESSAKVSIL